MISFHQVSRSFTGKGGRKVILDSSNAVFEAGHNYAIMGPNGAGKTSVMKLISGADRPSAGRVERGEATSWPMGFHGGFNSAMTGRENVVFVARIYGQDPGRILDAAADFADIGQSINDAVGSYSTGMRQRLAFGLSLAMSFDTYLVDEVTAVGDANFKKKCEAALLGRLQRSRVIMISHTISTIRKYCQRGMLLLDGQLYEYPDTASLIRDYQRFCS